MRTDEAEGCTATAVKAARADPAATSAAAQPSATEAPRNLIGDQRTSTAYLRFMPEETLQWWHRLPREGPVDRIEALVDAARGRRVVHVGFVDELMAAKQAGGVWLHERLAGVATSLVGLDLDEAGVEAARAQGYEAHAVDAQSAEAVRALHLPRADVVIAGELIEHLDAPGPFLRAMHELADE